MDLKLFNSDGRFRSDTTFVSSQSLGIVLLMTQLLYKRNNQSLALGTNCLMSSVWMSSRLVALLVLLCFDTGFCWNERSCKSCVIRVSLSIETYFGLFVWRASI